VQIEVMGHFFNDLRRHGIALIDERTGPGMLGQQIGRDRRGIPAAWVHANLLVEHGLSVRSSINASRASGDH